MNVINGGCWLKIDDEVYEYVVGKRRMINAKNGGCGAK